jgi:glutamate formiminotransferase
MLLGLKNVKMCILAVKNRRIIMITVNAVVSLREDDYAQFQLHMAEARQRGLELSESDIVSWAVVNFMQRYTFVRDASGAIVEKPRPHVKCCDHQCEYDDS